MNYVKKLLDQAKQATGALNENQLASKLGLPSQRISDYYKGSRAPDKFACLKISEALNMPLSEVIATVELDSEKDEKKREEWRKYYKSIGGFAASFMLIVFAIVTFIVTVPVVQAKETMTYDAGKPVIQIMRSLAGKIRAAISAVLNRIASAFLPPCFSG